MPKTRYVKEDNNHVISIRQLAALTELDHVRLNNIVNGKTTFTLTEDECTMLSNALYDNLQPLFQVFGFEMAKPSRLPKNVWRRLLKRMGYEEPLRKRTWYNSSNDH